MWWIILLAGIWLLILIVLAWPGLATCIIMALHIVAKYSWSLWGRVALQRYKTPLGTRSNLYISVTKPCYQRFSRISQHRTHYGSGKTGFAPSHTEILKLPIEKSLSRCHGFKLSDNSKVSDRWDDLWGYNELAALRLLLSLRQLRDVCAHSGNISSNKMRNLLCACWIIKDFNPNKITCIIMIRL